MLSSVLAGAFALAQSDEDSFRQRRDEMVRTQIAASRWGGAEAVRDARVLEAFREVPRHRFAPPELAPHAYEDRPLPIGYGQTISQPYIVAKMTELVEPKKDYRVLEIGTGSGYQAAILSRLVAEVYTIEIVEPLGVAARKRLADLGYRNVDMRIEDGYYGWPEKAPFDCIVVTAAANHIPPPLIEQLKPGGRMVIPVGNPFQTQRLVLVNKLTAGLPVRPAEELTTCPHEDLLNPERVHVDAYGNVHLCQGLSMGNIWEKPLSDLVRGYDAQKHPIAGPLIRGGPIRLVTEYGLEMSGGYVDECHLCYMTRKSLLLRFPQYLAPKEAYGL